jgi:hypothetical protein
VHSNNNYTNQESAVCGSWSDSSVHDPKRIPG